MTKTKEQLVAMVDAVMNASACTTDFESLIAPLEKQFPGVDIGQIIFAPSSGKRLSAEEVVDIAMRGGEN